MMDFEEFLEDERVQQELNCIFADTGQDREYGFDCMEAAEKQFDRYEAGSKDGEIVLRQDSPAI